MAAVFSASLAIAGVSGIMVVFYLRAKAARRFSLAAFFLAAASSGSSSPDTALFGLRPLISVAFFDKVKELAPARLNLRGGERFSEC